MSEVLETMLYQNGCLVFISPASSNLCLKRMRSSFHAWPGDLQTHASSTSLLPVGMQTPVASVETSGGKSTWLWGMSFLTAATVSPFLTEKWPV
jgi:hypothetical protein